MPNEWAERLIAMSSFRKPVATVGMPGHDRHILQMTLTTFVTDRAIVRMIDHQPFDDRGTEGLGFRIVDRNTCAMGSRGHAGHHQSAAPIMVVFELFDGTLAARAD
jgi:hypothetical protein